MKWYKFWVFDSAFDAVYGQVEGGVGGNGVKVFNAFMIQPSPEGMSLLPLTKNKQGSGLPFSTEENYLFISNPVMYAPVDENDEHFREVSAKLTSGIEIAMRMPRVSKFDKGE